MDARAQVGAEYLVNFGWALVLVLSIIGALFFLPSQPVNFSSSVPEKLVVEKALFSDRLLALKLRNPSSQGLDLVAISLHGSFKGASCSVEGKALPQDEAFSLSIGAGSEMILQCEPISGLEGELSLAYIALESQGPLIITLSPARKQI